MKRTLFLFVLLFMPTVVAADTCVAVTGLSCPARTNAGSLAGGDCIASDASLTDLWTFDAMSGDVVTIEMTSSAFDPYLVLVDPSGAAVMDDDDADAGSTAARITYTLGSGGTWSVVATSVKPAQSGSYTLALRCGSSSAPSCTYELSQTTRTMDASGGSITIGVIAGDGCAWDATTESNWLHIEGDAAGTGSGSITLTIAPNTGSSSRETIVQFAGQNVTVIQDAPATSRRRAVKS